MIGEYFFRNYRHGLDGECRKPALTGDAAVRNHFLLLKVDRQCCRGGRSSQIFGVLEREALGPPRRAGEFIEERDVVGAFRRLAHHFVDLVSVWPDQNAPAIGPSRMIVAACAALVSASSRKRRSSSARRLRN